MMTTKTLMTSNTFSQHSQEITKRFLLTAFVIDDQLTLDSHVHGNLQKPSRETSSQKQKTSSRETSLRTLDVNRITRSFARQGIICGTVSPQDRQSDNENLIKTATRADILILDWQLNTQTNENVLPFLQKILNNHLKNQLRLIAIYTGETDPESILNEIRDVFSIEDNHIDLSKKEQYMVDLGAHRIVVYLKAGTASPDQSRIVDEQGLVDHLIVDFAKKIEGLMSGLALTALTVVRENVYRILELYGSDLDPAFLAHRACLPQPQDSEQHIIEQISSELYGIMNDVISDQPSPAGIEAIKSWCDGRFEDGIIRFNDQLKRPIDQVLKILEYGIDHQKSPVNRKKYHLLSHGFSRDINQNNKLDLRLASLMCFRQVFTKSPRQLTMGTVIQSIKENEFLLCITPKCDTVRLENLTPFLFLHLQSETKRGIFKIVVPATENKFQLMTISMYPTDWRIIKFEPQSDSKYVTSELIDKIYFFKDLDEKEYQWIGELKPEFAQSIAHSIGQAMSRVPINKSEWLRREEKNR